MPEAFADRTSPGPQGRLTLPTDVARAREEEGISPSTRNTNSADRPSPFRRAELEARLPEPKEHLPALDGVRGLAILLVLAFHSALYCSRATSTVEEKMWFFTVQFGWCGVDLFFVLSGFLITGILLASRGQERYFRNFYSRRALRILPLFYGSLLLFFYGLRFANKGFNGFDWLVRHQVWFWTNTQNWVFVGADWPAPNPLGHFWSLAIEEQFYLVWPLVVFLVPPRALKAVCIGGIALSLFSRLGLAGLGLPPQAFHYWVYCATFTRLDGLCMGALTAILWREGGGRLPRRMVRRSLLTGAMAAAGFMVLFFTRKPWLRETFQYTLLALFFAAIIIAALSLPRAQALFSWAPLREVGKISYGMYVFHVAVMMPLAQAWKNLLWGPFSLPLVRQLGFLLVSGSLIFLVAWLSWHLYEKRFLRLKRHFAAPAPRGLNPAGLALR